MGRINLSQDIKKLLFFAGLALQKQKYLDLWSRLPSDPQEDEVRRNLPIRHPLIWLLDGSR